MGANHDQDSDFEGIMQGLREARDYVRGTADRGDYVVHVPQRVDVKAVRAGLGLTQERFAARFGFSAAAVRDWEQGRRQPEASARILLKIVEREPEAVDRALAG